MDSSAYTEGARAGRLVLQRCAACGRIRHYPQLLCPACRSDEVEHVEASGRGTVHSWTVTHHAFDPAFADALPYTLLTVEMEEGVRVLGRWSGADDAVRVGLPVRVTFGPSPVSDVPVPVFTEV